MTRITLLRYDCHYEVDGMWEVSGGIRGKWHVFLTNDRLGIRGWGFYLEGSLDTPSPEILEELKTRLEEFLPPKLPLSVDYV